MPLTTSIVTAINSAIKRGFVPDNESFEQDYQAAMQWLRDNPSQRMTRLRGLFEAIDAGWFDVHVSLPLKGEITFTLLDEPYNSDTDRLEYIAQDEDGRLYLVTE